MNHKKIILTLILFSLASFAIAEDVPPSGPPDGEVPIDGGISILVASGVALGARMWYKRNKK